MGTPRQFCRDVSRRKAKKYFLNFICNFSYIFLTDSFLIEIARKKLYNSKRIEKTETENIGARLGGMNLDAN